MADWAAITLLVTALGAGCVALARLDAFVPADVIALRRLERRVLRAPHRSSGASAPRSRRTGFLGKLDELRDLDKLLVVAGYRHTPAQWGLRVLAMTGMTLGAGILVDVATLATGNGLALTPVVLSAVLVIVPLGALLVLRSTAHRRRRSMRRALGDLLPLFAPISRHPVRDPARVDAGDLIAIMIRCLDDPSILDLFETNSWQRVVGVQPRSRPELFELIGDAYGLPEANRFASALRSVADSGNRVEVFVREARAVVDERTAEARVRAQSRGVAMAVPTVGLLLSLLIVMMSAIAAGTVDALGH